MELHQLMRDGDVTTSLSATPVRSAFQSGAKMEDVRAKSLTARNAKHALRTSGSFLIGLTGRRHQGKSTFADKLVNDYGFERVHAFEGGKLATERYFEHITGSKDIANRMVYGDLKDKPSEWLPGYASPRYFMERFGEFMGVQMGTAWTLEMEIKRLQRRGVKKIVAESLVYEDESFKEMGGTIIRVERLDYDAPTVESDKVQEKIKADALMRAATLDELNKLIVRCMEVNFGLVENGQIQPDPYFFNRFQEKF